MLNKPQGVVSATEDTQSTVIDILPDELRRKGLFPAGRLDKDTTGLLIITDDGEFAHRMLAPGRGVFKTYIAGLSGEITENITEKFKSGLTIDGGEVCLPAILEKLPNNHAQIKICEGKYHQVKRMFAALGTRVVSLKRTGIGALDLDESLSPGECRLLGDDEIEKIFLNRQ